MASTPPSARYQVRHILARLSDHGLFSERERITSVSDGLGLATRHISPRCKRTWSDDQAEFLILALRLVYERRLGPVSVLELAQGLPSHPDPLIAELRRLRRRLLDNGAFSPFAAA
jgi:hypothetical protein